MQNSEDLPETLPSHASEQSPQAAGIGPDSAPRTPRDATPSPPADLEPGWQPINEGDPLFKLFWRRFSTAWTRPDGKTALQVSEAFNDQIVPILDDLKRWFSDAVLVHEDVILVTSGDLYRLLLRGSELGGWDPASAREFLGAKVAFNLSQRNVPTRQTGSPSCLDGLSAAFRRFTAALPAAFRSQRPSSLAPGAVQPPGPPNTASGAAMSHR